MSKESSLDEKVGISNEVDRFANLLSTLIEKYADKLDLDALPEPPGPTDE